MDGLSITPGRATPTASQLAAAVGTPQDARTTCVVFGDSLTAQHEVVSGTYTAQSSRGYFHWANGFLGAPFRDVIVKGYSGQTSAYLLTKVAADVLASSAGWVSLLIGINDAIQNVPATTTIANIQSLIDIIIGSGRKLILLTVTPSSGQTAPQLLELLKVNTWIRGLAGKSPNLIVVDAFAAVAETTNVPITGTAIDGLHYNAWGAAMVGYKVAEAVRPFILQTLPSLRCNTEPSAVFLQKYTQLTDGSLVAAAGGTGTKTIAVNPRQPAANVVRWTFTDTGAAVFHYVVLGAVPVADATWAPGDTIRFAATVKWDITLDAADTLVCPYAHFDTRIGGNAPIFQAESFHASGGHLIAMPTKGVSHILSATTMRVLSNPILIPADAGINNVYLYIGMRGGKSGAGWVEVSDVNVWRV